MQNKLFIEQIDYSKDDVFVGLSGGINSAAVLIWLTKYPEPLKPKSVHLFYAHFKEHSPDTFRFVADLIRYARLKLKDVHVKITKNSVIDFFKQQKMIPHPSASPCTRILKIVPMMEYAALNGIKIDLVGYVKEEKRRVRNMAKKAGSKIVDATVQIGEISKHFPIVDESNEWCFGFVKKAIGWYPKIYDIRNAKGERIFTHNNCLPCKNMQKDDYEAVRLYYPEYYKQAEELSQELKKHWGRTVDEFHLTFGREDWETGFKKQSCEACAED